MERVELRLRARLCVPRRRLRVSDGKRLKEEQRGVFADGGVGGAECSGEDWAMCAKDKRLGGRAGGAALRVRLADDGREDAGDGCKKLGRRRVRCPRDEVLCVYGVRWRRP